jgi:hypothetical protein
MTKMPGSAPCARACRWWPKSIRRPQGDGRHGSEQVMSADVSTPSAAQASSVPPVAPPVPRYTRPANCRWERGYSPLPRCAWACSSPCWTSRSSPRRCAMLVVGCPLARTRRCGSRPPT